MTSVSRNFIPILLIWLFGLLAFTQVTFIPIHIYYLSLFSLIITLIIASLLINISIEKKLIIYLSLFASCFFVGILSYPISMEIERRFNYSEMNISGRVINLTLLFITITLIHSFHRKSGKKFKDYLLLSRAYHLGVLFVLVIGVWQLVSFYSSIQFPFETRSHLHSTYGDNYSFSQRLTSIAREPSFFVMLAIDFIGLSMLFYSGLKRTVMTLLGLIMVIFSLSPSGFITLLGTVITALILSEAKHLSVKIKFNKMAMFMISIIVFFIFFLINEQIFEYIYRRIFDASPSNSGRFYMIIMPYLWSFDGSLFNFLFGYGVKSYSIIGSYYNLPSGVPVHPTSNNIYTDVFWESGLIGLTLLLSFFILTILRTFKAKINKTYSFIAFYFIFELMFSSLFRADYASARFFIILYTIYVIIEIPSIRKYHGESNHNHS